jgi:hypothetical protein
MFRALESSSEAALLPGCALFGKDQPPAVGVTTKQACLFERLAPRLPWWHHAGSLKRFCRRGITIMKFWRWSFALLCGRRNQTDLEAHLNGNEERFAGIALWAFEGAQIETRFVRLAGQPHRFAASGAVQNSDPYSVKNWIGLSGQHDASPWTWREPRHSQSPIVANGGAVIEPAYSSGSIQAGQYCSFSKIETLPGHDN